MTLKKYDAPAAAAVLDIMEYMTELKKAIGPTNLARKVGLTPNLTFRILNVLAEKGYVQKNSSGHYSLTSSLYVLGMKLQNRFDLRTQARPFMAELANNTRESVQLQIPDGDMMLQLDFVPPPTPYYLVVTPGSRVYWHCNAYGKAVLAFLDKENADSVFALPRPVLTTHTHSSARTLKAELKEIRNTFSASEFEEYLQGIYCVASPVFDAAGYVIAAVGISGMTSRLQMDDLPELRRKIIDCARNISTAIGFDGEYKGEK